MQSKSSLLFAKETTTVVELQTTVNPIVYTSPCGTVLASCGLNFFFKKLLIDLRGRGREEEEKERERWIVVPLIHAFICCFLYVS